MSREDRRVKYGVFNVIYFQDLRELNRKPVKTLVLMNVAQVDILRTSLPCGRGPCEGAVHTA